VQATRCPVCHLAWPEAIPSSCPQCALDTTTYFRDSLPAGSELHGGKYRLCEVLGKGGFGITYRAVHCLLNEAVAIKEFFPQRCVEREAGGRVRVFDFWREVFENSLQRFLAEGRMLYRLREPGVIRCQDLFEENSTAYLVMEYLQGQTLEQLLLNAPEGRLPPAQAGGIFKQLLAALKALHAQEILHLDIKPDNIWIRGSGDALLLDFGSSLQGLANAVPQVFTPAYAPVELISLDFPTGPWTDIFQLAMVFYVVISGQMPVTALERLKGQSLDLSPLPAPWEHILESGLGLLPAQRPQSIAEWLMQSQAPRVLNKPLEKPLKQRAEPLASIDSASALPPLILNPPQAQGLLCLALSPDGREVFVGGQSAGLRCWELATGRLKRWLKGPLAPVLSLASSPQGVLAAGDAEHQLFLWRDLQASPQILKEVHSDRLTALSFCPHSHHLLSGSADKRLVCQSLESGQILWQNKGFSHWIQALACSANGKLALAGCSKGQLSLLDLETGQGLKTLLGHESGITALRFVPGKAEAFSSSWDKTLRLWDLRTGETLKVFEGHRLDVTCLALSPDGQYLLSGSWDRSLRLWDREGNCLKTLMGHTDYVTDLLWLPERDRACSVSKDGTLILWDLSTGDWLWRACAEHEAAYLTLGHQRTLLASGFEVASQYLRTFAAQRTQPLSREQYQAALRQSLSDGV